MECNYTTKHLHAIYHYDVLASRSNSISVTKSKFSSRNFTSIHLVQSKHSGITFNMNSNLKVFHHYSADGHFAASAFLPAGKYQLYDQRFPFVLNSITNLSHDDLIKLTFPITEFCFSMLERDGIEGIYLEEYHINECI